MVADEASFPIHTVASKLWRSLSGMSQTTTAAVRIAVTVVRMTRHNNKQKEVTRRTHSSNERNQTWKVPQQQRAESSHTFQSQNLILVHGPGGRDCILYFQVGFPIQVQSFYKTSAPLATLQQQKIRRNLLRGQGKKSTQHTNIERREGAKEDHNTGESWLCRDYGIAPSGPVGF